MSTAEDKFMTRALVLAKKAAYFDEVPVGALVVLERDPVTGEPLPEPEVVAEAYNSREQSQNPVGHAELLVLQEAAMKLGRWRLAGCTLYVTLEPCVMCAGAIILSRVDRVVYGARDPKAGAVVSVYRIFEDGKLNHKPKVLEGILAEKCSAILSEFFKKKRAEKN